MREPKISKLTVDEMLEKVREETERSKISSHQEGAQKAPETFAGEKAAPAETSTTEKYIPKEPFDQFLWKYGTKYANIINKVSCRF